MNILIVDDDPPSRAILRDVLEGAGYAVDEAADGVEALRRLAETTVHCIITDILMPSFRFNDVSQPVPQNQGVASNQCAG